MSWQEIQNLQVELKMNDEELVHLIAIKNIENVGDKTIEKLFERFKSFKTAWNSEEKEIKKIKTNWRILSTLLENRNNIIINEVINQINEISNQGITIGNKFNGQNYPERLYELKDSPSVVYIKGTMDERDKNAIAIVGTRKPTTRGKFLARKFAFKLAQEKFTIVSGLAKGIDTEAHLGALKAKGRTIAVLGTGFNRNVFYPKENYILSQLISENGYCITEFPPYSKGLLSNFYRRNRIISVLSNAVLIIELKNKNHSGTLTQAYYAKNQGRKIFILKEIVEANKESIGWKTLKREVKPIIVEDPDEIIDEINSSTIFQKNLIEHQLEIKGY